MARGSASASAGLLLSTLGRAAESEGKGRRGQAGKALWRGVGFAAGGLGHACQGLSHALTSRDGTMIYSRKPFQRLLRKISEPD